MNRDPVAGLTQRRSFTHDQTSEITINTPREPSPIKEPDSQRESSSIIIPEIRIDPPVERKESSIIETNLSRENDEERFEIELAIRISLEDQQQQQQEAIINRGNDEELELAIEKSLEDQQQQQTESSSDSDSDGKLNK